MSDLTYEFVHANNGNAVKLLPEILRRANEFNDKYNDDLDPNIFMAQLVHQAYQNDPDLSCIAILDGDEVVGHCIICLDVYYGERFAVIMHLEIDEGRGNGNAIGFLREGMVAIDEWTRLKGCTYQRIWARNKVVARHFRKLGFEDTERVLMERRLIDQPVEEE